LQAQRSESHRVVPTDVVPDGRRLPEIVLPDLGPSQKKAPPSFARDLVGCLLAFFLPITRLGFDFLQLLALLGNRVFGAVQLCGTLLGPRRHLLDDLVDKFGERRHVKICPDGKVEAGVDRSFEHEACPENEKVGAKVDLPIEWRDRDIRADLEHKDLDKSMELEANRHRVRVFQIEVQLRASLRLVLAVVGDDQAFGQIDWRKLGLDTNTSCGNDADLGAGGDIEEIEGTVEIKAHCCQERSVRC